MRQIQPETIETLRADLLYIAGDIRALALQHPEQAAFVITLGDMVGSCAAFLPREPGEGRVPALHLVEGGGEDVGDDH